MGMETACPLCEGGSASDSGQTRFQSIPTATNTGAVEGNEFEMVEQLLPNALDSDENKLLHQVAVKEVGSVEQLPVGC